LLKPISEIISSIYNLTFLEIVKREVDEDWWKNRMRKEKAKVGKKRCYDDEDSG
jgi:hypothetical protein